MEYYSDIQLLLYYPQNLLSRLIRPLNPNYQERAKDKLSIARSAGSGDETSPSSATRTPRLSSQSGTHSPAAGLADPSAEAEQVIDHGNEIQEAIQRIEKIVIQG